MKKIPVILALVAVAVVAYSMSNYTASSNYTTSSKTITASTNITKEIRNVFDFDKLEVQGVFQVDVSYSSKEEVEIEAPDNLHEYIELNVKSGTLNIELSRNTQINSSCSIKIHIKTSKLNGFELSGASSVKLNNTLKDNSLSIESSGAASFKGDVDVNEAAIELDGAATVNLSGNATNANLELSGASQINDYSFEVDHLEIELSGASSAKITSSKAIVGDVSGASSLTYRGNPSKKNVSVSGAATMSKK
ncbi:MAG: head GIN domain-containing protein [Crocinitomicaceae bacterium]